MDKALILKPRMSEKTFGLSESGNTYTFEVPGDANKHSVARAVTAQYEVTVLGVNIVNVKGKPKRTVRKGGRAISGNRSDIKKAYVTLKAGDKLPIFATEEDDKKADKKATKKETK
jgi:large subunit ribosomal protein L23